jgi:protein tyrosine phosphatase (PTP) superfamily phosphohydrolase (DUF442 family)
MRRVALLLAMLVWTLPAPLRAGSHPSPPGAGSPTLRPASWAEPMTADGVPNLFRVSATLYRSAQPSGEGMKNLERLGVKTVVNLRSFHSDRDEIEGGTLRREHLTMKAWHPEEKEAVAFLRMVTDPERLPILVHCQHGADRTGTMVALYRIAVQGWSKEEALDEMTRGGFGFHEIWTNLPPWIMALDIDRIRKEAGLLP